jgi:GTP-binding protein
MLVVNKADNQKLEESVYDFYSLGLGTPHPVSAIHGRGIGGLLDTALGRLGTGDSAEETAVHRIAITGRPNVGKSLFLNTLLDKERVIVDDKPGTTRDSVDTYFTKDGSVYLLIDTAGIRHKRKVKDAIDVYSMSRSREAIERSDVSFLLIDGYDGLRGDDIRIFNLITASGKCCVLVVNKWDLVKGVEMSRYKEALLRKTPSLADYPMVFASARTGRNLLSCVEMVKYVTANAGHKIGAGELNRFLEDLKRLSAKVGMRRPPKIHYITQTGISPPAFLVFTGDAGAVNEDYSNFVQRSLRKAYNLYGTPVRVIFRSDKKRKKRGRR